MSTTTSSVSEFIVNLSYNDIEKQTISYAKKAILDTVGVAIGGSDTEASNMLANFIDNFEDKEESSTLGKNSFRTSCLNAALVNGFRAHVLDYDDVYPEMSGHPSAPLVSAIISLGEKEEISGEKFLEAYIAGFEVQSRLAEVIFPEHDKKGWHSTSTTGVMGAAAASARILNLNLKEVNVALGIAGSLACGLRQNFGTMTKPLHAGNASKNGIFAALLAHNGFTAYEDILDATYGYCKVFSGKEDINYEKWSKSFGKPLVLSFPNVGLKKYPSCFATHQALDAILGLLSENDFSYEDIEEVRCETAPRFLRVLSYHSPDTEVEAKFSMEYCIARAIIDKKLGLEQFTLAKIKDPQVRELETKVKFTVHPKQQNEEGFGFSSVTVILKNGDYLKKEVTKPSGSPIDTIKRDALLTKYLDCTQKVLPQNNIDQSLEYLENLEKLDSIKKLISVICVK
jgi:2-methylcitrate dehydratase PrpD